MGLSLDNIFSELDYSLTLNMRLKTCSKFTLEQCYKESCDNEKGYCYNGVFGDNYNGKFRFYTALFSKNIGHTAIVDGQGTLPDKENIFWIQQMFDDKYNAIEHRGHIKPLII